ncbi:MAG: nucleotidyl transferase AbiEii/AbiGii toxin family protein [Planctomycetota bacterium]
MFPVEAFRNTLGKAVAVFERHAIRFHLTGGLTSVIYGEPRMTQDIDIVIDNHAIDACLESFISSLNESDFIFDVNAIRHAVKQRGMFQLFDNMEALKLDIYPRELIAGELNRSQVIEVFDGMQLPVASRADAAASKLVWISKGSHKSRRDLRQIYYRARLDKDRELIRELAVQLGLVALLDEVLGEPDEILD